MQVIVLGFQHTGTSMVGGILHKIGINMGEKLKKGQAVNPYGFYEDLEFKKLCDKISLLFYLKKIFKRDLTSKEFLSFAKRFESDFKRIIDARERKYSAWGCKVIDMTYIIPVYQKFLSDPYYIITRRNEKNAIQSSLRKNPLRVPHKTLKNVAAKLISFEAAQYIESMNSCLYLLLDKTAFSQKEMCYNYKNTYEFIKRNVEGKKSLWIEYEEILRRPSEGVGNIIRFLNLRPTEEQYRKAISFAEPRLNHKGKK